MGIVSERVVHPARWAWAGALALVAAAALGLLSAGDLLTGVDAWWHGVAREAPEGALLAMSSALDVVGGGRVANLWIPLALMVLLLLLRRPWGALLYAVASLASTAVVQLGKAAFGRERPDDILIDISSAAYPSGHTAFAATLAMTLWLVFPRWWVAAVGIVWTVAMAFSRTQLSAHWLTDTVGGALAGAGVALVVGAFCARRIAEEPASRERS